LARKTGKPFHFPHDNKSTTSAIPVGAPERRKIEQLYPWDFQLYTWQLARCGENRPARDAWTPMLFVYGQSTLVGGGNWLSAPV
jgi:hypothetical protein